MNYKKIKFDSPEYHAIVDNGDVEELSRTECKSNSDCVVAVIHIKEPPVICEPPYYECYTRHDLVGTWFISDYGEIIIDRCYSMKEELNIGKYNLYRAKEVKTISYEVIHEN